MEAIARVEASATRVQGIATSVEAIAIRVGKGDRIRQGDVETTPVMRQCRFALQN